MNLHDSITAIITAYNSEKHLAEAIESVLAQTLVPAQIVVVDDGSTDRTPEIARSYTAVEWLRQENRGPGAARNAGLRQARKPWVAFLDADDLWLPEKLEKQQACLDREKVDLVYTGMCAARLDAGNDYRVDPKIIPGICATTLLARRDVFSRLGVFSEDRRLGEFIDWMARVEESGLPYRVLPEALATRRIHTTNLGITAQTRRKDYVHIVRQIHQRRRTATDEVL